MSDEHDEILEAATQPQVMPKMKKGKSKSHPKDSPSLGDTRQRLQTDVQKALLHYRRGVDAETTVLPILLKDKTSAEAAFVIISFVSCLPDESQREVRRATAANF